MKMNGQWIGRYKGSSNGQIIVNVDERQSFFEGVASIINDDRTAVDAVAFFKTKNKSRKFRYQAADLPVNPRTGYIDSWDAIRSLYPSGTVMSRHADVRGNWNRDRLEISWKTDIGFVGKATLPRSKAGAQSDLVAVEKNWSAFKEYVAELEGGHFLFRGQNRPLAITNFISSRWKN
jgi:hypothetical protein